MTNFITQPVSLYSDCHARARRGSFLLQPKEEEESDECESSHWRRQGVINNRQGRRTTVHDENSNL